MLWEYIELDDALHWLSTLGGAFSNLGEHSQVVIGDMFAKLFVTFDSLLTTNEAIILQTLFISV